MGLAEPRTTARPVFRVIAGGKAPRPSTKPFIEALDDAVRPADEPQEPARAWSVGEMVR
ncbi:MAG: hypothetical protein ACKVP4_02080 [Hyphomicrobium sp.]